MIWSLLLLFFASPRLCVYRIRVSFGFFLIYDLFNGNNMSSYTILGVIIGITLLTALGATLVQQVAGDIEQTLNVKGTARKAAAPIATSGDNKVYVAW